MVAVFIFTWLMAFICIFFLVVGLLTRAGSETGRARQLSEVASGAAAAIPLTMELAGSFSERVGTPFLVRLGRILQRLTPAGVVDGLRTKLERTGNPNGLTVAHILGLWTCTGVVFLFGALFLVRSELVPGPVGYLLSLLFLMLGCMLPEYWLQSQIATRETAIRRALPDAIDILVACAEAGLSLDQGISELIARRSGPLVDEFDRLLKELALGKGRAQAWRDLSQRIQVVELRSFSAAICQAEELGTSIASVLRIQSDSLRTRRSLQAREAAGKLPVKMLFPLVFFIFPALFTVILGPAVVSIYRAFAALAK